MAGMAISTPQMGVPDTKLSTSGKIRQIGTAESCGLYREAGDPDDECLSSVEAAMYIGTNAYTLSLARMRAHKKPTFSRTIHCYKDHRRIL